MSSARAGAFGIVAALSFFGCGSEDPALAPPPIDPQVACATRATWPKSIDCLDCQSRAAQPYCDCSPSIANGTCHEANVRRTTVCATSIIGCVNGCNGDCSCVDACYTGAEACRANAADFDGCIIQTCAPSCR
ncbi:hypothetical protein BH09MYX1_BH09MYX1_08070 [soil metagenome]